MGLAYDQNKYMEQAKQQYDSSYNAKVNALKNQLAQNQQALDQQKTGVNNNYDIQVNQQNLNNKLNKNNVSNAVLGRGLSNSSIAVSGLAEQDAKNTRLVGNINRERTSALNDIEAQKTLLAQNLNNTLAQMAGDRESELMALARELYNQDWNRDYQERQLAQQMAIAQLQASSYGSGGSGGYGSRGGRSGSSDAENYGDTFGAIIGSNQLNNKDKFTALQGLYKQAQLAGGNDNLLREIERWGKANPIENPTLTAFAQSKGYDSFADYSSANKKSSNNKTSSSKKSFKNLWGLLKK